MNRFGLLLPALCLIAALSACESVKGITGRVTDGMSRASLEGASVELFKCEASGCDVLLSSQTTGEDGRYNFPDAPPGRYLLSIVRLDSPPCPGIQPFETMGVRGEFVVAYSGYGGIGVFGSTRMIATHEFELAEGGGVKLDLDFACP